MNTSKLLVGLQALSQSLPAKALQNTLCRVGGMKPQRDVRAFLGLTACPMRIFPRWRDRLTRSSQHLGSVARILEMTHRQCDQLRAGWLQAPVLQGTVQRNTVLDGVRNCVAVFVPPPGTRCRSEIISLKIVKCVALHWALFANWVRLCDENLLFIHNSLVTHC